MRTTKASLEARVANLERIVAALPLAFGDLHKYAADLSEQIERTESALNGLVDELLPDAVTDRAFEEWTEDDAVPGADAEFHKPML